MDLHRPRPMHGLRDILTEVSMIVVGILIALALEQAVQTFHERMNAGEAREAVRAEVRENLWWLDYRGSREPCVRQRLHEIGDLLDSARRGGPTPVARRLGLLPHIKLTTLRWEANAEAGRASLFGPQEQRYLGNIYYTTEQFRRDQDAEEEAWAKLRAIQGLDHLTPSEIDEFSILLAQARYENWEMLLSLHRAHQWAALMHLTAQNPQEFEIALGQGATQACPSITASVGLSASQSENGAIGQPEDMP